MIPVDKFHPLYIPSILLSILILLCVVLRCIPFLSRNFIKYGKLLDGPNREAAWWLRPLMVPKRWFNHFYLYAFLLAVYVDIELLWALRRDLSGPMLQELRKWDAIAFAYKQPANECILAILIVLAQVTRRLYETYFVQQHSNALMNIAHYAVGFTFYTGVVFGAWVEGAANLGIWSKDFSQVNILGDGWLISRPRHVVALLLYGYAAYHQYRCHRILASLRQKKPSPQGASTQQERYVIPRGDWFEFITVPHYFAEILVYFSLVVLTGGKILSLWLCLLFTVSDLSLVGYETAQWYQERFGAEKMKRTFPKGRWVIIPGLF
ncbi:uncharacterized protein VTP21DRAFT_10091 [Calcarisporiella thermophila]|uniref:uncharacterized protein n=1 Tax=Calcarisporiella thermophila TaxID=911321 RepID=UPI0037446B02